ncbi:MAG: DNA replication and repair protein RecF [Candidatus Shapirobacteria bacterium]|jgi:DNA replication and repair protein RecF
MYLSKLHLNFFRSYTDRVIEFGPKTNLIVGHNGTGKTNILEAIYFLSSGKSFRSSALGQLIKWDSTYTIVTGIININDHQTELECQLSKEVGKVSATRKFFIDKVVKTRPKYLGTLKTVVFEPEDIRLVTGSPTRRRDYLDSVFSSTEWRYAGALSQYNRALKHRNELLDMIRENRASKSELFYWDQSLIKNATVIQDFRQNLIRSVNHYFSQHPLPEIQQLSLNYRPSVLTQEKLDQQYISDLNFGYTQAGIHRDDFSFDSKAFSASDKNLAFWGSRGQQRLAVLALRLAQINYLEETYHQKPILLLDDIFSELDPEHRQLVVDICHTYQTIFTSAEETICDILPESNKIIL